MTAAEKSPNRQLFRFCLYGFLKNQQYFEPFLIIVFRDRGLSFTMIGALMAFRAVCVNVLEVPSGAMADGWGRRRSMIMSMFAYIASFTIFALVQTYWLLFPAMFMFAVGEAFRTGTHKAMIFDWLKRQGRQDEKTRIYGLTRSWSKIGSALNVIIAAVAVVWTRSYQIIFWISIVPYVLNVINFMCYPKYLDSTSSSSKKGEDATGFWETLKGAIFLCTRRGKLRTLIAENVCFEGFYSVAKDYLQPLLKMSALALPILVEQSDKTRTAILVALVFAALNLLSSFASRKSHKLVECAGGETAMARFAWLMTFVVYAFALAGIIAGINALPILGFVCLAVLFNVWKPVFVSRFSDASDSDSAATTLSIANQSKTLSVVILAPLLGIAVDHVASTTGTPLFALWPVAILGIVSAMLGFLLNRASAKTIPDAGQ